MADDQEIPNTEPRFDQWQYDFLKQCTKKREAGIKEWNEWRKQNPQEDICLDEQDLSGSYLCGINFMRGLVGDAFFTRAQNLIDYSGRVYLRKADFRGAHVKGGRFSGAYLDGSQWEFAKARGAEFSHAKLQEAKLGMSVLDECTFNDAVFLRAQLTGASIRGAKFLNTNLCGCTARTAIVDGASKIWRCKVDVTTDFTGVGLAGAIIDPATKQLLEYNIRRMNWEEWYTQENEPVGNTRWIFRYERVRLLTNRALRWLVRCFWEISDYGISTKRVIWTFFKWAMVFALIYYMLGSLDYYLLHDATSPGMVSNLFAGE